MKNPQNDVYFGNHQNNLAYGSRGNDTMFMYGGNDIVTENPVNSGDDIYYLGGGDDFIYDWSGRDMIFGASGNDHVVSFNQGSFVFNGGNGRDEIDLVIKGRYEIEHYGRDWIIHHGDEMVSLFSVEEVKIHEIHHL